MSGHSKWSTIKRKKAKVDAQRGKIFTRLSREIIISARRGGGDPEHNPGLKAAIQRAKEANIPNENIQRAIMRGTGESGEGNYEETIYEGYGPGGAAIMLEIMTDNRNRTAGEIRHIFSRNGGNLGETGCVSWMFERKGIIIIDRGKFDDENLLMSIILNTAAEDLKIEQDSFIVITSAKDLEEVKKELTLQNIAIEEGEITMIPINTIKLENKHTEQMMRLLSALEEHDDVQEAYTNVEPEE